MLRRKMAINSILKAFRRSSNCNSCYIANHNYDRGHVGIRILLLMTLVFSICYTVEGEAQVLGPQRSLRKLSRKLRMGVEPSLADQDQLAAIGLLADHGQRATYDVIE